MRITVLLVAFVLLPVALPAHAQQPVPDAPQPQQQPAQKKQPAKAPDPPPAPASDDNAFPEGQSKAAADKASQDKEQEKQPPSSDDNAFPEAQSKAAADQKKQTPDKENQFPQDQSKAAAKAAGHDTNPVPAAPEHDPARSKKDDEVGRFYLDKGDYRGALLRYQDATAADPTNVNAIFGLAESQHNLKQNSEALKNYQLYLQIVPDGPKAKQAMKALKEIETGK